MQHAAFYLQVTVCYTKHTYTETKTGYIRPSPQRRKLVLKLKRYQLSQLIILLKKENTK